MSQLGEKITLISLNVNGIGNTVKRRMLFKRLRMYNNAIICLQETHVCQSQLDWIQGLWGGKVALAGNSTQSAGVMILLSKDVNWSMKTLYGDRLGHYLIVRVEFENHSLLLANLYMPTADKEEVQIQTLNNIESLLLPYVSENIVAVGDFNVCFDSDLDRHNHVTADIRNPTFRSELSSFLEAFSLIDVWRVQHFGVKGFSWARSTKASRLDYVFMLDTMLGSIRSSNYRTVSFSDHSMLEIKIGKVCPRRGPGFWKLNTALLQNVQVFEEVVGMVQDKRTEYAGMDPILRWELLKFDLKTLFRDWTYKLNRERNILIQGT